MRAFEGENSNLIVQVTVCNNFMRSIIMYVVQLIPFSGGPTHKKKKLDHEENSRIFSFVLEGLALVATACIAAFVCLPRQKKAVKDDEDDKIELERLGGLKGKPQSTKDQKGTKAH